LLTSLFDAIIACSDAASARSLFDVSRVKDAPMYGAMMKGYVTNTTADKAIDLFNQVERPNDVLVTLLLNAAMMKGQCNALTRP
jgi:hypothetical protein